jgi:hypothetical protein
MDERIHAGLRQRRRVQVAGWASLVGLVACFLVLLLLEHRLEEDARIVRGVLVLCLLAHFAAVAYLRFKRCPSCGERFLGAVSRGFGSYTTLSQGKCDRCGAELPNTRTEA